MPYLVTFEVELAHYETGRERTRKFTVEFDSEEAFDHAEEVDYMWDDLIPRFDAVLTSKGLKEHVDGAIEIEEVGVTGVTPDFVY